ncbi:Hypothetical predicted protein [Pelobates cultripes]|uniref:Uncharacterized protein n=1 Tax=Pelobates cultripes TaxID=61616 RepID=A0AAD1SYV4_PELCU|nr:Hypothetical predicted protein [Pelobates cultripes]
MAKAVCNSTKTRAHESYPPTSTTTNADHKHRQIRHLQRPAARTHSNTIMGHLPIETHHKLSAPLQRWASNQRQRKEHSKPALAQ